jgi:hypothetical protein
VRPDDDAHVNWQTVLQRVDLSRVFEFDATKVSALRGIKVARGEWLQGLLTFKGSKRVPYGQTQQFAVIQLQGGEMVGGSTYELRLQRARALHPVSHIRVVLERVKILDDHDPWFKHAGEFHFTTVVSFNQDDCRRHWRRIPQKGTIKIDDFPTRNERALDVCIFDGFVAESDRMEISMLPVEEDWLDPDDELSRYRRQFEGPPETWVGRYAPSDEPSGNDPERQKDWRVWYRVESLPF